MIDTHRVYAYESTFFHADYIGERLGANPSFGANPIPLRQRKSANHELARFQYCEKLPFSA